MTRARARSLALAISVFWRIDSGVVRAIAARITRCGVGGVGGGGEAASRHEQTNIAANPPCESRRVASARNIRRTRALLPPAQADARQPSPLLLTTADCTSQLDDCRVPRAAREMIETPRGASDRPHLALVASSPHRPRPHALAPGSRLLSDKTRARRNRSLAYARALARLRATRIRLRSAIERHHATNTKIGGGCEAATSFAAC